METSTTANASAFLDPRCESVGPISGHEDLIFWIANCEIFPNESMRQMMLDKAANIIAEQPYVNRLSSYVLYPLLFLYCTMIIFGACGSGLVIYVVVMNRQMRTPRNVFITNLAISDLTLCLFTQPFNVLRLLYIHQEWVLGDFMCKLSAMFQGTNIFVSTISITAIALDRFQVIVYPTRTSMKSLGAVIALVSIWTISFIMASPLVVFSQVTTDTQKRRLCSENIQKDYVRHAKIAYSIAAMLIQYTLPLLIVIVAYARICVRLEYRMVNAQQRTRHSNSPYVRQKRLAEKSRQRRTNFLLSWIAIIFALSWLPLNIMNIVMDIREQRFLANMRDSFNSEEASPKGYVSPKTITLIQFICLLVILSSACSNPVLYGWLNENFRREFLRVFSCDRSRRSSLFAQNGSCSRVRTEAAVVSMGKIPDFQRPNSSVPIYELSNLASPDKMEEIEPELDSELIPDPGSPTAATTLMITSRVEDIDNV